MLREHLGRTSTIEWLSVASSAGERTSVQINYETGLWEITDQYFAPWSERPIAAVDNPTSESDTSYLIGRPDQPSIEIEAFNVFGACPNGDVISTGRAAPNFDSSYGPGRIHSVETAEILVEFEPQYLYCTG